MLSAQKRFWELGSLHEHMSKITKTAGTLRKLSEMEGWAPKMKLFFLLLSHFLQVLWVLGSAPSLRNILSGTAVSQGSQNLLELTVIPDKKRLGEFVSLQREETDPQNAECKFNLM